jgi:Tol biopolymer transport system component
MRRTLRLLVAVSLLLPSAALALHRKTPRSMQITQGSAGEIGSPHWGGYRFLVFDSNADLVRTGSQGRQVFLFDLRERALRDAVAVHQLTTGPGDSQRPSTGRHGRTVVYDGLVDGTRQVFKIRGRNGTPQALTRGDADSWNVDISENESFAVFESNADFLGSGLGGTQIYRIDLRGNDPSCPYPCPANGNAGLTQISFASGGNHHPVMNRDGDIIAFESDADPLQTGEHETQIYVASPAFGQLKAASHGPGASRNPTLSRNGSRLAFESSADLLHNGSTGTQIFLYRDVFYGMPEQVTSSPGALSTEPSISTAGRALLFISTGDLAGRGNGGSEVFQYDLRHRTLQQLTDASGSTLHPTYSAGVFTAFVADGDLLGTGATGQELYFVNLFKLGGGVVP